MILLFLNIYFVYGMVCHYSVLISDGTSSIYIAPGEHKKRSTSKRIYEIYF